MAISNEIDDVTARMVRLFPRFYCLLRQLLKANNGIDEEELVILQLLRAEGGKAKRPVIWERLALDSKKYAYRASHLIEQGFTQSQRQGRESTDVITEQGNQRFEEIKNKIKLFIEGILSLTNDEERKTIIATTEILDSLSKRVEAIAQK